MFGRLNVGNMEFCFMAKVHIGNKIKEVLDSTGMSVTSFASKINMSRPNVYDVFDRENMDTGLLLQISKVLDHDFFNYYRTDGSQLAKEARISYIRKNEILSSLNEELKAAKKRIAELERQNQLLEKLNALNEEKIEMLQKKKSK
jgi:hypothetical protein